jgi:hypothetical protein
MHDLTLRDRRSLPLDRPPRVLAIAMACTTALILAAGLISLAVLPSPTARPETANATGAGGTDGVTRELQP